MKTASRSRMAFAVLAALGLGLIGFAPVAKADWNPGDPYKMHFPQLPDLTPNGVDVLATYGGYWFNPASQSYVQLGNKVLADDFMCTQTGPITDIHIWGSWLSDARDLNARFHLSIHSDIPAGVGGLPYSTPGPTLWSMDLNPAHQRFWGTASEQFYDPNSQRILGADTQVWQYNFYIDPLLAFHQQAGMLYWLDVQYIPTEPFTTTLFGWKTSLQHFQDDGVYGDNLSPGGDPSSWAELIYPTGQSRDLAFVITTPEPSAFALTGLGAAALLAFRRRR